jgi:1-deoxy-D-xylulose-5-phosphate reductoisomerase
MMVPIALGLGWPDRVPDAAPAVDWTRPETWQFFPLDDEAFPAVRLAREAGVAGGTAPAVYNAANEVGVEAFRSGAIRFTDIVPTIERVLGDRDVGWAPQELTVEDVLAADAWARTRAAAVLGTGSPVTTTEGTTVR